VNAQSRNRLTGFGTVLVVLIALSGAGTAQSIRVKDSAEVESQQQVLLGDVAAVTGVPHQQAEMFERIPVCAAPVCGVSKDVEVDYLIARARQQGVPVDDMRVEGADRVRITARPGNTLTPEYLSRLLETYIRAEMPWSYDEAEITCHPTGRPLQFAGGKLDVVIRHEPAYDFVGEGVFPASVYSDGRRVRSLFLKAHIEVYKPVAVADEHIGRGGLIAADRVTMRTAALSTLRGGYYTDPAALEGLQARRDITPRTVITPEMVERPLLVKRGDNVMLKCKTSNLDVTVKVRARSTGRLGEVVTVESPSSRKTLCAVVTGPGEVELP